MESTQSEVEHTDAETASVSQEERSSHGPTLNSPSASKAHVITPATTPTDGKQQTLFRRTWVQQQWRRLNRVSQDTWLWEITGIALCIACLTSIVGIFLAYDQKQQPQIAGGISLTTTISILATIARAAVIFVAASVIAQQKWLEFVRSKNSLDIIAPYDDATRGPLGSLVLLFTGSKSLVVIVVALITVLALGFEPFVQQSLKSPLRNLEIKGGGPSSTIQTVAKLAFSQPELDSNTSAVYYSVLLQGLYADAITPLQPSCVGSTCDWSTYYTTSVCSLCEDMLDEVTVGRRDEKTIHDFATFAHLDDFQGFTAEELDAFEIKNPITDPPFVNWNTWTNYTIRLGDSPAVYVIANMSSSMAITGDIEQELTFPHEVVFDASKRPPLNRIQRRGPGGNLDGSPAQGVDNSIYRWTNLTGPLSTLGYLRLGRSKDGLRLKIEAAMRCAISLCARQQVSTIVNGSLQTQIKQQTWGQYFQEDNFNDIGYNWTATIDEHTVHMSGPDNSDSGKSVVSLLDENIKSLIGNSTWTVTANWGYNNSTDAGDLVPNTKRFLSGQMQNASERIAQAYTNHLQQNSNTEVSGKAYIAVPFVDVQWLWLIYPITLVVVCLVNLVVTIYQTRRWKFPKWKTSIYPLLFAYGVENDRREATNDTAPSMALWCGIPGDTIVGESDSVANDSTPPIVEQICNPEETGANDLDPTTGDSTPATTTRDENLEEAIATNPEVDLRPREPSKPSSEEPAARDQAEEEGTWSVKPGKLFPPRSPVVKGDLISTFEAVAGESVVQLIRSDGRWVFEKPDPK